MTKHTSAPPAGELALVLGLALALAPTSIAIPLWLGATQPATPVGDRGEAPPGEAGPSSVRRSCILGMHSVCWR